MVTQEQTFTETHLSSQSLGNHLIPSKKNATVQSPDFKYRKSENPYSEKIRSQAPFAYTDDDTEHLRGQWRRANETDRIVVEIGCNGGHVLNEHAVQNPNAHHIGIDWKFKQISLAADKALRRGLTNVTYLRANAQRLHYIFAESEIDELHVYFPDPWPKRAQRQNRLLSHEWFELIHPLLTQKARIHFKTDHREYFETVLEELTPFSGFEILSMTKDKHAQNPKAEQMMFPQVTLFERLFIKDGLPIHELWLEKTPLKR